MTLTELSLKTPPEIAQDLADSCRTLRLGNSWTRRTLAERAGISVASLKRFENTGNASLDLLLRVAHALGRLEEFDKLLKPPQAYSLAELEKQGKGRIRKRGSR